MTIKCNNLPRKESTFYALLVRLFVFARPPTGHCKPEPRSAPTIERFLTIVEMKTVHVELWEFLKHVDRTLNGIDPESVSEERISVETIMSQSLGCQLYHVHRLDCETTGILLFAKTSTAAAELCSQFRDRKVCRHLTLSAL